MAFNWSSLYIVDDFMFMGEDVETTCTWGRDLWWPTKNWDTRWTGFLLAPLRTC